MSFPTKSSQPARAWVGAALLITGLFGSHTIAEETVTPARPCLKALLVTSGCCHNYPLQTKSLQDRSAEWANIDWTVVSEGGRGTDAQISLYDNPDWAKPYDVVVHNECFASTADEDYIHKITKAHHDGAPAVVIHCAMHTYRAAEIDDWREFLGVTSRHHEHQSRYPVKVVASDHPIMQGFPCDWITPMDELYVVQKVWPNTTPLAMSTSERTKEEQVVFWTNTYGKAKVFGTTYGHSDETFQDTVFLDAVTRGMLWASGKLD